MLSVLEIWLRSLIVRSVCFFFQAEDGIRDLTVTGVQTCALPILDAGATLLMLPFSKYPGGDVSPPNFISASSLHDLEISGSDRKSTRLNSSHSQISYAVFCLKKDNHL